MSVSIGRWAGRPLRLCDVRPCVQEVIGGFRLRSALLRGQHYMVAVLLGRRAVGLRELEVQAVMSALSAELGDGVVFMFRPHKGLFLRRDAVDVEQWVKRVVDCLCRVPGRFVYVDKEMGKCEVVTDGCDGNGIPMMVVL